MTAHQSCGGLTDPYFSNNREDRFPRQNRPG